MHKTTFQKMTRKWMLRRTLMSFFVFLFISLLQNSYPMDDLKDSNISSVGASDGSALSSPMMCLSPSTASTSAKSNSPSSPGSPLPVKEVLNLTPPPQKVTIVVPSFTSPSKNRSTTPPTSHRTSLSPRPASTLHIPSLQQPVSSNSYLPSSTVDTQPQQPTPNTSPSALPLLHTPSTSSGGSTSTTHRVAGTKSFSGLPSKTNTSQCCVIA